MHRHHLAVLYLTIGSILLGAMFRMLYISLTPPQFAAAFAEAASDFIVEVAVQTPSRGPSDAPVLTELPTPSPTGTPVLRVEVIRDPEQPELPEGKRILIYHTHTWEAYQQVDGARYQETEKWRTKDDSCNVTAVGRALASSLTALGFTVVHDETTFEPPDLDGAYGRSLAMLEERQAAGERYDLYIDLHRDALASSSTVRRTVNIAGEDVARFMVLVGKGTTGGYAEKPDWEKNHALAQRITDALNSQHDGLARDIKVKTGRFNQHVAPCCVLLECGVNSNTLEEVLRGVPYLAQAIADALSVPAISPTDAPTAAT